MTRKGLHREAESTFTMCSEGRRSEQRRCSNEREVSIWRRVASGVASEIMGRTDDRLN